MNVPMPLNKQCNELAISDFATYPIWGFADDDGDEVMPVEYPGHLIWPDGGEALFIACEFTFGDGTKWPGAIGVRMTDHSIYLLEFPQEEGKLFRFPVNSMLEGSVTLEQLTAHLNKSVAKLFPITYSTPYVFENGQLLIGYYDVKNKDFPPSLL